MRMSRRTALAAAFASGAMLGLATAASAENAPRVGAAAPAFTATDSDGHKVSLADYAGKTVVLEWTNDGCPFVGKHYGSKSMQALQSKWTGKGVVWLSVISSAPGEQGFATPEHANELTKSRDAHPSAVLLDPAGDLGREYNAQTTPHMFVIKGDGKLAYMGGIDDKPSTRQADLAGAHNFVDAALTEIAAGKPVSTPVARPYGCTVKYSS